MTNLFPCFCALCLLGVRACDTFREYIHSLQTSTEDRPRMGKLKRDPNFRANALAAASVTPERAAKDAFTYEAVKDDEGRDTGARRVRFEDACPLDAYLRRNLIDWRQHDAGSWLARTHRRAVRSGPVGSAFQERVQGGSTGNNPFVGSLHEMRRNMLAAGLAFEADDGAISLTVPGRIAVMVCCYEEWAGGTRNLDRLRDALDRLADALKIGTKRR
jgi:hypothetical protein